MNAVETSVFYIQFNSLSWTKELKKKKKSDLIMIELFGFLISFEAFTTLVPKIYRKLSRFV